MDVLPNVTNSMSDKAMGIHSANPRLLPWAVFSLLAASTYLAYGAYRRLHTAPGPPRLPILGNIFQMPTKMHFIRYTEWARQYGPIFSLDVPGRHVVVVNTFEAAGDLFDRQSKTYNDRPRLIMASEILGDDLVVSLVRSGEPWRRTRRAAHESFSARAIEKYQSLQHEAAIIAMLRTLTNPLTWEANLQTFTASAIASTVYGWPPLDVNAPLVRHVQRFIADIGDAALPGAYLVDAIPWMKHIPSFVAPWKRHGMAWHEKENKIFEAYRDQVAEKMEKGDSQENFVAELIESQQRYNLSMKEVTWLPATMFLAGTDTAAAALLSCVLAMLHYPDALRKAQAELDNVVGRHRAPTFEDSKNLPYMRAIVREILRWRPPAPLGLPHTATEDGWYSGYFIPKGAMVVGNVWAMNRDPSVFPDFDTFRPERFLDETGQVETAPPDTHQLGHTAYGFGTRICPGMHFANQELFIAIAVLLWSFDIRPLVDERGEAVLPPTDAWEDDTLVIRPASFQCNLTPRFPDVQEILENTVKMSAA